ncbi:hypothetical protein PVK06_014316 [Gossypium arboreum]|uniref:MULE transposase domain-containing protein n=1 Tax=Gossypium arboreum TaxID=29729 RepID=A0ABR0PU86_GOSAR|nr:hypothetical protein PVK06_014316 [Gossypium arboreum]
MVQVDRTWLYSKYMQILLMAVAQDSNRNVLLIAFAIVEYECFESWEFFLRNLRRHVIRKGNICLISDRSKGLLATIRRSEVPWRLATLMSRIGLRQAKQIEAKHMYVEAIRKATAIDNRMTQIMNAELYSRYLETFWVQKYISHRSGLLPRSYLVDL